MKNAKIEKHCHSSCSLGFLSDVHRTGNKIEIITDKSRFDSPWLMIDGFHHGELNSQYVFEVNNSTDNLAYGLIFKFFTDH